MAKQVKVLFFARLFYPHIGGVEKHVLEVGKRLVDKGYDVTVVTEKYQQLPKKDNVGGIEIIRINAGKDDWFKKIRVWLGLFKNINLIFSSDVIHCHDVFFWYLPFKLLFPLKKVFTTFHGYEGNNLPTKKSIFMHKLSEKLSLGNICVGGFFKKWYGTKPTIITYGAVDESKKINKKSFKKNKIIFFGRLEKETGIMEYLKALKILKIKDLEFELDIYGEGSLRNHVIKFSKENKLKVNLKNFIPNIESVLNNYEYVFCSRYLSILESMLFSKLVFAEYNNAIKKDYLQTTPFAKYISISGSGKEIATNLENAANNKLKLNTARAYDWVKTQTWGKMVNNYLKLWKLD